MFSMPLVFNRDFKLSEDIKKRFASKGLVKLESLFIGEPLSALKARVHFRSGSWQIAA